MKGWMAGLVLAAATAFAAEKGPLIYKSVQGSIDKVDLKLRAVTMRTAVTTMMAANVSWRAGPLMARSHRVPSHAPTRAPTATGTATAQSTSPALA